MATTKQMPTSLAKLPSGHQHLRREQTRGQVSAGRQQTNGRESPGALQAAWPSALLLPAPTTPASSGQTGVGPDDGDGSEAAGPAPQGPIPAEQPNEGAEEDGDGECSERSTPVITLASLAGPNARGFRTGPELSAAACA